MIGRIYVVFCDCLPTIIARYERTLGHVRTMYMCTGRIAKKVRRCPYMPVKYGDLYGHVKYESIKIL